MQILKDRASANNFIQNQKQAGKTVGLVPTMGALHLGHLNLVSQCRAENDITIASIFVNPIQFNNSTDLAKYPRTFDDDCKKLITVGCDAVFYPPAEEMYPAQPKLTIDFGQLDKVLEGEFRPGHFSGVGIVVAKLFNILQPDTAYFGQKDFQQYLIIKQLVKDLSFPVKLVCANIVREADGLAMSSRNQRLSAADRTQAALLHQVLQQTKADLALKSLELLKKDATAFLLLNNIQLEYLALANRETLEILTEYNPAIPAVLLIAGYLGEVRLIDNILI